MDSAGNPNPNPWSPYEAYKDCSLEICSSYCPQWCFMVSPPPPPGDDDDSSTDFSPLIIAVIGILASVFLLVSYYTIISKYCRRRDHHESGAELEDNNAQNNETWPDSSNLGLDESLIKSITVRKFKNGDPLVNEGKDCSVCLSEFEEGENIRILPKCNHAFHLPCIDPWLKSHSSCPLCRSSIGSTNPAPNPHQNVNISALEHRYGSESVLVIEDLERGFRIEEDVVVAIQPIERSISMDDLWNRDRVLVADILRGGDDDDEDEDEDGDGDGDTVGMENGEPAAMETGSSTGNEEECRRKLDSRIRVLNLVRKSVGMKRPISSTGRFIFTR